MSRVRRYFGDAFVAIGASFLVLSVLLAAVFFIAALPEANPYVAALASFLLIGFFIAGGVVFVMGVLLERGERAGS